MIDIFKVSNDVDVVLLAAMAARGDLLVAIPEHLDFVLGVEDQGGVVIFVALSLDDPEAI